MSFMLSKCYSEFWKAGFPICTALLQNLAGCTNTFNNHSRSAADGYMTWCAICAASQSYAGSSNHAAEDNADAKRQNKIQCCCECKAHERLGFYQAMVSELVIPQLNLHFCITSIDLICSRQASYLMHFSDSSRERLLLASRLIYHLLCTCHRSRCFALHYRNSADSKARSTQARIQLSAGRGFCVYGHGI